MKRLIVFIFMIMLLCFSGSVYAEDYKIDTRGAHAFIQFKISHLGYSWLYGRFNSFDGSFRIDRDNLENSSISLTIDPSSVDSNHAERDKHLRSADFLNVGEYPEARFESTSLRLNTDGRSGVMRGNLTLLGVTKPIDIDVTLTGEGSDPWGGYRVGFEGNTTLSLKDFNVAMDLGPASSEVEMILSIEGIRQ